MISFAKNTKAKFDYTIEKELECSLILFGQEVKAIREHRANLKGEYCMIDSKGVYTKFHIGKVDDPTRLKTVLCTKKEREKMMKFLSEKGTTIIPLELYQDEKTVIRLKVGFCRGKKQYEKRETIKERDLIRRGDGN
jgi:SsrA-binding protein